MLAASIVRQIEWGVQNGTTTTSGVLPLTRDFQITGWLEPKEEWFWPFEPFSELKTAFCEYWKLIDSKISMTCVYKEYEIKTKMVQKHWR